MASIRFNISTLAIPSALDVAKDFVYDPDYSGKSAM
jgi:hypothetical protein